MRMPFMRRQLSAAYLFQFLCAFALCAFTRANAAEIAGVPGVTLAEAVGLAMRSNPALSSQRFVLDEAASRRDQAGLRPPLVIEGDVENVLGTGRAGVLDSMEATLRLSTVIEMGEKRALRVGAAESAVETATVQRDIQALDLLALVTRRFIANLALQAKVTIAYEHVGLAREVAGAVDARLRAGIGSPLEEGNALIHLREEEIELAGAEADFRRSWAMLAATWGAPPDGTGRAEGALMTLDALPPFTTFAAKIEGSASVARFTAERIAAEAQSRLTRAERTPDITVSGGVRRLEALNDQALVFGFSVPLGTHGRNAAAERAAEARLAQASVAETTTRIDNAATLFGLYEQALQARTTFLALRDSSQPVAEQTLKRAQEGFRAGRFSLFDVSAAQEQLHEIEEAAVDAAESYHQAIAEIERLTAAPVDIASTQGTTP